MDMGALKNVIQLVAAKKIVLSEEEMATIMFKVYMNLCRFWTVYTTSTKQDIQFIAISNLKIFF